MLKTQRVNDAIQKDISINGKNTFIVDEQFIDVFKKQFAPGNLDQCKQMLKDKIEYATNIPDMFIDLEEHIYLHKVANHPNLNADPK
jgi:hypothetical protein